MTAVVTEPMTARVAVFKNRQNQAVRIPKAMSFPDDVTVVEMTRYGDVITLRPSRRQSWDEFVEKWAPLIGPEDEEFFAYLEERHDVLEYRPAVFEGIDDDEADR